MTDAIDDAIGLRKHLEDEGIPLLDQDVEFWDWAARMQRRARALVRRTQERNRAIIQLPTSAPKGKA